jgi:hypothetical protein
MLTTDYIKIVKNGMYMTIAQKLNYTILVLATNYIRTSRLI